MRVNNRVFTEKMDMLDFVQIPKCPSQLRVVAENIVNMAASLGYSMGNYHTMTELDKMLMWDYWRAYDKLPITDYESLKLWFTKKATAPDLITRARRWLVEHNYLIIKPDVSERAYEAESKFSRSIKG